jgi:phosphoribosylanthranilate isomerase
MTQLRMKVCGITRPEELRALASVPVEYAGLWHGVRGGRAELPLRRCRALADFARACGLEPVIVTLISDPKRLRAAALVTDVPWLQLHGYQTPTVVHALKRSLGERTRIIKTLHVRGGACGEQRLIAAYERAGTDAFLLDSATADGRLGSTGRPLDADAAAALIEQVSRPFLLAGGLDAGNCRAYAGSVRHSRCLGIDVDTSARGPEGTIASEKVRIIRDAWTACRAERVPD